MASTDSADTERTNARSESQPSRRRRFLLTSIATGLAIALAGCFGDGSGSAAGNGDTATETTGTPAASGADATESDDATTAGSNGSSASGNLDLREANVVGVGVEGSGNEYTFDVTLHHDVHESCALVSQPERLAFW